MDTQQVLLVGGELSGRRLVLSKHLSKIAVKVKPRVVTVSTAPEPEEQTFIYNLVPIEIAVPGTEFCIDLTIGLPIGDNFKDAVDEILDVYSCYCQAVAKQDNEPNNANEDLH
jgi:hypothetical protein